MAARKRPVLTESQLAIVESIRQWLADRDTLMAERDDLIAAAVAAGVEKTEVARFAQVSRSTLYRILDKKTPAPG